MSRAVTYETPDEIYQALEQMAATSGRPTEALILEYLARQAEGRRDAGEQASGSTEGGFGALFRAGRPWLPNRRR